MSLQDTSKSRLDFGIFVQCLTVLARPNELVLKDVSLSINAGEKIGVCGRTGR